MHVLLISTYDLGRPSFGMAEPAAWLVEAGATVDCVDLSLDRLPTDRVAAADLIAFHVPMHTATRLALELLPRVRAMNPRAHLCFYGLYAPPNEAHLRANGVATVLGGELEPALVSVMRRLRDGEGGPQREPVVSRGRLGFRTPDRRRMPELSRHARLLLPDGERRVAGYTEASRGCRHLCGHCPVVPVYGGRFRVVDREVILADVQQQLDAGARHMTFGDPDFFNGPGHARSVVTELHRRWPELTYDVTVKVEHLLRNANLLRLLKETGCLFVTTAVESADDRILEILDKGHTRADFEEALRRCRELDLDLAPTFVPFTPWTTRDGYLDLLRWIAGLDLVDRVAPVQLAIRLLVPPGSRLLALPDLRRRVGPLDPAGLVYPWRHDDPEMDRLAGELLSTVESMERDGRPRREIFAAIWDAGARAAGVQAGLPHLAPPGPAAARMSEPWYCCAEPSSRQQVAI